MLPAAIRVPLLTAEFYTIELFGGKIRAIIGWIQHLRQTDGLHALLLGNSY